MEIRIQTDDVIGLHRKLAAQLEVASGPEVYSLSSREFAVLDSYGRKLIFSQPTDDPPTCVVG